MDGSNRTGIQQSDDSDGTVHSSSSNAKKVDILYVNACLTVCGVWGVGEVARAIRTATSARILH
jgi:hypothetical protein